MKVHYLLIVVVVAVFATPAKAQVPVCVEATDAYQIALADLQGNGEEVWLQKVEHGDCATLGIPLVYLKTLSRYGDQQVVDYILQDHPKAHLYGIYTGDVPRVWGIRDNGQYANVPQSIRDWYTTQHNKHGGWCCTEADGEEYTGDYQLDADGSVEFDVDGVHYHLPDWQVLDNSNPTGHAV